MSTKIAALAFALALAGVVYGVIASQQGGDLQGQLDRLQQERDTARAELDQLRKDLRDATEERDRLLEQVELLMAQLVDARGGAVAGGVGNGSPETPDVVVKSGDHRFDLRRVEEADAIATDLSNRGDLEGLWLLAAELLSMGEPGFEKLVELAALLDAKEGPLKDSLQQLWRHEELLAGRFFQTLSQHTEEVLQLGLYLDQRGGQLPEILRDFHRELDDEMGVMLLGLYAGDDQQILESYTDRLESSIAEDLRRSNDAIRALGGIRTERSTDILISLLDQAEGRLLDTVVQSLAWQRDPRALTALSRLRVTITDPARASVIDAAIRYLR